MQGPKDHQEAKLPQSPRTWMCGPTSSFLSAPAPSTTPSHLYQRMRPVPLPSHSALFLFPPSRHPLPSPGQADAIGASSLRDPAPYLSSVRLLFLTSFSPSRRPQALGAGAGWVRAICLPPSSKCSIRLGHRAAGRKMKRIQPFSNPMPIGPFSIPKVNVPCASLSSGRSQPPSASSLPGCHPQ